MANSWPARTVADLQRNGVLLVEDGNHGEYRPRPDEFVAAGVAFIRAADMDSGRVLFDSASKINEVAQQRITKGIGAPGDVLLSHKGTVGKVALVPATAPPFVCSPQTTFWRTCDESKLDRAYLYAFLRSPGFHAQLETRAGETDMAPYVSLTSQRGLSVVLPPIRIQSAIARVLGGLDDKIELNRRMNETLEGMSRALFKSWFVDFDPVRAKLDRRPPPGLDFSTAALFPDRFEHTDWGLIPKGWSVAAIRDLASDIQYGLTQSASSAPVGPRFLRITDIQGGRVDWGSVPYCEVTPDEYDRYRLQPRDILVARTGASTGENVYLPVVPDAVFASYLVRFQFSDHGMSRLVGAYMRTPAYFDYVGGSIGGSAQPNASAQVLAGAPLVIPPAPVAKRFAETLAPLDRHVAGSQEQSRTLAALRDALLPKLLSGEIRIPAAEKLVEEVA